ncbi:hypothetical protein BJ742DRAFT_776112 [Cladochytrium replicatum]|nr:hypothetical protein BJ742DRAFT_776112 [Cladochytrium replicatum]
MTATFYLVGHVALNYQISNQLSRIARESATPVLLTSTGNSNVDSDKTITYWRSWFLAWLWAFSTSTRKNPAVIVIISPEKVGRLQFPEGYGTVLNILVPLSQLKSSVSVLVVVHGHFSADSDNDAIAMWKLQRMPKIATHLDLKLILDEEDEVKDLVLSRKRPVRLLLWAVLIGVLIMAATLIALSIALFPSSPDPSPPIPPASTSNASSQPPSPAPSSPSSPSSSLPSSSSHETGFVPKTTTSSPAEQSTSEAIPTAEESTSN